MLKFENLCAGYDGADRLHHISADVPSEGLTCVIGPNGCGKTTLLKCAAGILKPSSGSVSLDGRPLPSVPEKERARMVSYMPQSRTAPEISVWQLASHGRYPHLKWGQSLRAGDREIIGRSINQAGLSAFSDRCVSLLSGGERQRAYLAMMLAQQTPLMLLDEPTAYLDLAAQFSLMQLLKGLCREGRSAVVVLHDLALALEYADRIMLLKDGRLIASGTPESVYTSGKIQAAFGISITRLDSGKYVFSPAVQEVHP